MPIARAKSAKRRTVKIAADRAAGGGAFVLDADAVPNTRTTIPIASKAIGTLSRNSQRVGQLIEFLRRSARANAKNREGLSPDGRRRAEGRAENQGNRFRR